MPDFKHIYNQQADAYHHMIAHEDYQGNLLPALRDICDLQGADVIEFGAGTGRLTVMLAPIVSRITAFDISPHMLGVAQQRLTSLVCNSWQLGIADNAHMPIPANSADLSIEGWSFGHLTGWYPEDWREALASVLGEMQRITRPGGTAIMLETLGTGYETPHAPTPALEACYALLESTYGFSHRWIRTDYRYESPQQAADATRFFFGDALANRLLAENRSILPECTGIWYRTY